MSKNKRSTDASGVEDVTSAGVPWTEVPEFAKHHVEYIDGRHGAAPDLLPPVEQLPVSDVLLSLPRLHPDRPRGATAMMDVHGAQCRLQRCRPGAWLVSPRTGWMWAKWPDGEVGWVPENVELPATLHVSTRNNLQ